MNNFEMTKSAFYAWLHNSDWITIPQRDSDPVDPKKPLNELTLPTTQP